MRRITDISELTVIFESEQYSNSLIRTSINGRNFYQHFSELAFFIVRKGWMPAVESELGAFFDRYIQGTISLRMMECEKFDIVAVDCSDLFSMQVSVKKDKPEFQEVLDQIIFFDGLSNRKAKLMNVEDFIRNYPKIFETFVREFWGDTIYTLK